MAKNKLIYGWGINDSPEPVSREVTVGGKRVSLYRCPFYDRWAGMLERCYSQLYHKNKPTYIGCVVCDEWKYFSNFKSWVQSQPNKDWMDCQLDKDVIIPNNKIYSPDTCAFVTPRLNSFLTERLSGRGEHLLGVYWHKESKKFVAKCSNPLNDNPDVGRYLGLFHNEVEAHFAWKAKKHEYACILAEYENDPRVSSALKIRYIS